MYRKRRPKIRRPRKTAVEEEVVPTSGSRYSPPPSSATRPWGLRFPVDLYNRAAKFVATKPSMNMTRFVVDAVAEKLDREESRD